MSPRLIHCCACNGPVLARLTTGAEIYPHRDDLAGIPFWRCDACRNYVGCHHKTTDPTRPLGVIPTQALRAARNRLHIALDSLWKSGRFTRSQVYLAMSRKMGYEFHVGETKTLDEVNRAWSYVQEVARGAKPLRA